MKHIINFVGSIFVFVGCVSTLLLEDYRQKVEEVKKDE